MFHYKSDNDKFFVAEEFVLEDMSSYKYLTRGATPVPGVDDALEFRQTIESMQIMGMNAEDIAGISTAVIRMRNMQMSTLSLI